MARKRRNCSPEFKAKIVLVAIKGLETVGELVQKHKLRATQINLWKKQLLDGASDLFGDGRKKRQGE